MTTRVEIDKFGRILIPKRLRDALHVKPGETVEVNIEDGALTLRPVERPVHVVTHRERLVLDAPHLLISDDPMQDLRDARQKEVLGEW